ncbi:MAG: DUF6448 family protein [Elusimicrobiales bacterium]|nr:DUF6448 family protein [Elusimicrobiales bacterium]
MKKTLVTLFVFVVSTGLAGAHCDSLDGPVVVAARTALESGNPDGVLAWVRADDEAAIREAFAKTLGVRKMGAKAAELADTWFFETLVRVHRAGEGAPYTGLKPAGSAEEIVKKLDASVEKGDIKELAGMIAGHAERSIAEKFGHVMELKKTAGRSVEQGRAYVAAYVEFMHYVEGVKNAVHGGGHHAAAEEEPAAHKH